MGLPESAFKPFSCLSHCKVSCDSPCCVKLCGEDNHCNIDIDTHEAIISDSEEEHIEKTIIIIFFLVLVFLMDRGSLRSCFARPPAGGGS